ncbi:MAG: cytochrome c oxidase subunit 3 [Saprospiraceae bacterium]|nr:cytochrome c oxidase subunit 3 [Saprospiraceae bacterium]
MEQIDHKKFFYPPGGILIWMIILVELVTFTAGIGAFVWQRSLAPGLFAESQQHLSTTTGLINTLVLLTSGYFMAEAVRFLKLGETRESLRRMLAALLLGIAFLTIKGNEYAGKLAQGLDLTHDTFFTFYWLLTGFHFMHVLAGSVIISVLALKTRRGAYHQNNYLDIETGAAFWHLCDIIWLLLFPVLYLMK